MTAMSQPYRTPAGDFDPEPDEIDPSDTEYMSPEEEAWFDAQAELGRQQMAAAMHPSKTMLQQAKEALANALVVDPHRPTDPAWELDYARAFALVSIAEDVKAIRAAVEAETTRSTADEVWAVVDGLNQRIQ
jgi:hypothetical protein